MSEDNLFQTFLAGAVHCYGTHEEAHEVQIYRVKSINHLGYFLHFLRVFLFSRTDISETIFFLVYLSHFFYLCVLLNFPEEKFNSVEQIT